MSQKVISGLGSIAKLSKELSDNNINNLILVTGKNSFTSSGAEKALAPLCEKFNEIQRL